MNRTIQEEDNLAAKIKDLRIGHASWKETAEIVGLSRERCRQILAEADARHDSRIATLARISSAQMRASRRIPFWCDGNGPRMFWMNERFG